MGKQADALRTTLKAVAKEFPQRVSAIHKDIGIAGLNGSVDGTPVDTGRLRAGWDVGIDSQSDYMPPKGQKQYARDAKSAGERRILNAKALKPITVTNNVEYAQYLETGGYEPKDPGPSKGRGRKGTKRRRATEGVTLVKGGFHAAAPAGLLHNGVQEIKRRLQHYHAAGIGLTGGKL